jgi:site-specific recombinase XerD
MGSYRRTARRFLSYLHANFPRVHRLTQLRRDPHLLGWFRSLCEQVPPLGNHARQVYLFDLRRLILDSARDDGYSIQPGLILPEDFPPQPQLLPRALSPDEDQRVQQELRRMDDLPANALLLARATGIRIGECMRLALDCLRHIGPDQWALHVPLGKLYTERLVPADDNIRQIVARILDLRSLAPACQLVRSAGLLLPRTAGFSHFYDTLRQTLVRAAERAGCPPHHVTPHRLRHTYATDMIRWGVSLPALMRLLGHKDIKMTMLYVQVTQQDLQREFHAARHNAAQRHSLPQLPLPVNSSSTSADLPGICQSLAATRHLLEMFRRDLPDHNTRRKLQRLDKRLLTVNLKLRQLFEQMP